MIIVNNAGNMKNAMGMTIFTGRAPGSRLVGEFVQDVSDVATQAFGLDNGHDERRQVDLMNP